MLRLLHATIHLGHLLLLPFVGHFVCFKHFDGTAINACAFCFGQVVFLMVGVHALFRAGLVHADRSREAKRGT